MDCVTRYQGSRWGGLSFRWYMSNNFMYVNLLLNDQVLMNTLAALNRETYFGDELWNPAAGHDSRGCSKAALRTLDWCKLKQ